MTIRNDKEAAAIRRGGQTLARILALVVTAVRPGISTKTLDTVAADAMHAENVEPAFLGYHGFPAVLCTSVNTKVVHGIPSAHEVLNDGDIIGLDIGIKADGLYTDMAVTVGVGKIPPEAQRLIAVTKTALDLAIKAIRPGVTTGDIGALVQKYVEDEGYGVVRDLVGHGVGRRLHEEPVLPNFGVPGRGTRITEGMVLAFEPMVTAGDWHVQTLDDGWSIVTLDQSLTAHFEHTILVTKDAAEIVTRAAS